MVQVTYVRITTNFRRRLFQQCSCLLIWTVGEMKVRVVLSCKHEVFFESDISPRKDEHIWCRDCKGYLRVEIAPASYRVDCLNCEFVRRFGNAKTNAEITGIRHALNNTGHVVQMLNGRTEVRKFGGNRDGIVMESKPESSREIPY